MGIAAFLPDDRGSRGSGCHFQHQHLRGSCFRRVSDALMGIFMGRTVPSAGPSNVWLADLIEAAEVLAASAESCDPAIVRAFSHRLEMPGLRWIPNLPRLITRFPTAFAAPAFQASKRGAPGPGARSRPRKKPHDNRLPGQAEFSPGWDEAG